jgi:putative DNA primase/helicase
MQLEGRLAARPHDVVIVTEGEKAADAAMPLFPKCVATTSANGAKAPGQSDWTPLSGRTVWIWHDHDEPGRKYAASVAKLLKAIAAEVKTLRIDGEHPDNWDAADALAEGWTPERGYELVDPAIEFDRAPSDDSESEPGDATDTRPVIPIIGGELPRMVDAAERALIASGQGMYQRDRILVRPIHIPAGEAEGILRRESTTALQAIDATWLVLKLTEVAVFEKWDGRRKRRVKQDCPPKVAQTLLAKVGDWRFKHLRGFIEAPTLRTDGSILESPGYDEKSELLFVPGRWSFPEIPQNPTKDDAASALKKLLDLLAEFPFVTPEDRAVAICELLTGLVRRSFPTAPLFGNDAPTPGGGKSVLGDLASILASGREATCVHFSDDKTENEKRLGAILIEGDPLVMLDEIEEPLQGSMLNSVLTQRRINVRILGVSKTAEVSTCTTFIATGNNLALKGADLVRRTLMCRIDTKMERPDEREFEREDIHAYAKEQRGALVQAALTVLRAYVVAGRPKQDIKRYNGFNGWSNTVRSALVWLGEADPCAGRRRIEEKDEERAALGRVLRAWHAMFNDEAHTIQEAIEQKDPELTAAFHAVAGERGDINRGRLGIWISKFCGRSVNEFSFERAGRQHVTLWRVVSRWV